VLRPSFRPGITVEETKPPKSSRAAAPLVVSLRGPDFEQLRKLADAISAVAGDDIVRDPPKSEPEQIITPDRNLLASFKIPMVDVAVTLRALGGMHVGTFASKDEQHAITVKGPATPLQDLMPRIRVRSQDGQLVPLASVVTTTVGERDVITRRDRERTITLSVYRPRPDARGAIAKQQLPAGYRALVR
jgi:multidrug efflux pump subunit AcrB